MPSSVASYLDAIIAAKGGDVTRVRAVAITGAVAVRERPARLRGRGLRRLDPRPEQRLQLSRRRGPFLLRARRGHGPALRARRQSARLPESARRLPEPARRSLRRAPGALSIARGSRPATTATRSSTPSASRTTSRPLRGRQQRDPAALLRSGRDHRAQ